MTSCVRVSPTKQRHITTCADRILRAHWNNRDNKRHSAVDVHRFPDRLNRNGGWRHIAGLPLVTVSLRTGRAFTDGRKVIRRLHVHSGNVLIVELTTILAPADRCPAARDAVQLSLSARELKVRFFEVWYQTYCRCNGSALWCRPRAQFRTPVGFFRIPSQVRAAAAAASARRWNKVAAPAKRWRQCSTAPRQAGMSLRKLQHQ